MSFLVTFHFTHKLIFARNGDVAGLFLSRENSRANIYSATSPTTRRKDKREPFALMTVIR